MTRAGTITPATAYSVHRIGTQWAVAHGFVKVGVTPLLSHVIRFYVNVDDALDAYWDLRRAEGSV